MRGFAGRLLAHGVLDGRVPPPWETQPDEFPLVGEVLANATGLIVHSHYVEQRARESGYRGPVWRIAHPAWPTAAIEPAHVEGRPVFGCFGHLNASKRIPQLIEAFEVVRLRHPHAKLLLVGPASPGFDADRLVTDGVERIDYVDEERLWSLLAACDACISLRAPTMGETSGSAIRALSLGRPLVVSDLGWFSELPDDVALKVPVDDDEIASLAAALELLAPSAATQLAMSDAARAYAAREHDLGHVAEEYAAALEEAAGGAEVAEAVDREVAHAAAEIGIEPGTPFAAELAARLDDVGLAQNGRPGLRRRRGGAALARASPSGRGSPGSSCSPSLVPLRPLPPCRRAVDHGRRARSTRSSRRASRRPATSSSATARSRRLRRRLSAADRAGLALFGSVPDAYAAAKAINALVMSLAAVPVYFLARRVVARPAPRSPRCSRSPCRRWSTRAR